MPSSLAVCVFSLFGFEGGRQGGGVRGFITCTPGPTYMEIGLTKAVFCREPHNYAKITNIYVVSP